MRYQRERVRGSVPLAAAWEQHAPDWIAWVRAPGHDSYWRYHRDLFLEIVPAPGRLTLDVGCGEGRLSRDLKALGHTVVGVDASPTAVAAAREADPSIEVREADGAALPFPDGFADIVVAFMSLQDVDDAGGAIREAARVLEPGGRLCAAIVHPLNSAGSFETLEADSPFVVEGSYLDRFRYRDVVERDGLAITFESEHRSIEWYTESLAEAGFVIERMREPAVPEAAADSPRRRRWQRIPLYLHIRAVRP